MFLFPTLKALQAHVLKLPNRIFLNQIEKMAGELSIFTKQPKNKQTKKPQRSFFLLRALQFIPSLHYGGPT